MAKNLPAILNTEKLMAAIAGRDVHFATPITNEEWFLYDIYEAVSSGGGSSGTTNYNALSNRPQINGVTLSGNKSTADLGIIIPDSTSDLTNDSGFVTESELDTLLADYVTENIFDATISGFYTKSEMDTAISGKVDKVSGMGLSQNSFSNAEKTKLAGLENYDDSALQNSVSIFAGYAPKIVSTNMTSESLSSETNSCICGYMEADIAGKAGWGVVRTYSLSNVAARIIQIAELADGERKTRFNNNDIWSDWM